MTKINAQVVADSKNEFGDRITTLLITFPRIILAEVNTHRALSKNTSSSRAIPFNKMIESVSNDPFIPMAWQEHHSGMQGTKYLTDEHDIEVSRLTWIGAKDEAIYQANALYKCGVTKQLCNRLLEPYMWTTMLITGTDDGWNNFFSLRCPEYEWNGGVYHSFKELYKTDEGGIEEWVNLGEFNGNWDLAKLSINRGQAEIHMMELAECIYDVMQESKPKDLLKGEWHIPFEDKISRDECYKIVSNNYSIDFFVEPTAMINNTKIKISTGMAARTSYTVVGDEKEPDYKVLINIHDKCLEMNHSSVFEHCAKCMGKEEYTTFIKGKCTASYEEDNLIASVTNEGWCRNYRGFIPYRHILESGYKNM